MPSNDGRTNDMHNNTWSGVVKKGGTGPRKAPPKAWPSNKPPGGKLPSKGPATTSEVVMPSDDGRTNRTNSMPREGVIHRGVRPRKAPPKAWPSNKPPGGKLPSKGSESAKKP